MEEQVGQTVATSPPAEDARAPGDRGSRWGWDVLWLGAIVLTAFVLRLIYVLQLQASPYFNLHVMDPGYHHEWATAFAAGKPFWDEVYFRAPLYPWFLGTIYWLFGSESGMTPRIVQAVLGSLSCGLLYLIGRRVFSRPVGVIAGFSAATYWVLLYFDAELLLPVLLVFLDLILLWLLLWTGDRRSPLAWGLCGIALGISAIARPNILLLAPALVVWILVLHRPHWRRFWGYSACLFFGTILPILPITIRNYIVGGELVLIASQGGVNFYIGNNPHSNGRSAIIQGDPGAWRACYAAQLARAEKAEGRPLTASEVSRWYFHQALRFMGREPVRAGRLLLAKLGYFWSHWEVSNNQDMRFIAAHFTPVARYLPLGFWIVGPLGVLGLLLSLRRAKELFPLWGFVLIYMLSVVLFFVTARFRVPVVVVLILLGSYAVCWCASALRARRWGSLSFATLVLIIMGLVAARTPPNVDLLMIQEHRETGIALACQDRFEEAEQVLSEYVKRAEATNWTLAAEPLYHLGRVRIEQGKVAEAVRPLEQALEIQSYFPDARRLLGFTLAALGRFEESVAQYERIVRHEPEDAAARANLAGGLARLGRMEEATAEMLRAIEIEPRHTRSLIETTKVLRFQGRSDDALRLLRAAVERFPEDLLLTAALVKMLARSSNAAARAEAVRLGEEACERTSGANARVLDAAALAQFRVGRPAQAVATARQALDVANRQGQTTLADEIEHSLRRYEAARRP